MPPIELALDLLLRLVLPAVAACALVVGVAVRLVSRKWWHLVVCLGAAAGLLTGNAARGSLPFWPDSSGWPWLFACAMMALVIGASSSTNHCGRARRFVATAAATAAVSMLLVPNELRTAPWITGMAAVVFGNAILLETTARRQPGWFVALLWSVVLAGGAAIVLVQAHSARLADGAILLASSLGSVGVVAIWTGVNVSPLAQLVAVYMPGVLLAGYYETFSEVPAASFALVAAAPLSLFVTWLPPIRRWPTWVQGACEVAAIVAPVALAAALAIRAEGFGTGF